MLNETDAPTVVQYKHQRAGAYAGTRRHSAIAPVARAAAAGPTTVRVGWIGDTHFTDMYVMSHMLNDPSVKLRMYKFQLSQDEVNALAANDLDMASMGYIFFWSCWTTASM